MDETGPSYSQDSTHWVREWVGEDHRGCVLFVQHDAAFICNLEEKRVSESRMVP